VDLLMMGRPEGPGCYCYANALLRDHIGRLSRSYQYIVMDNEAGMEHLSRRTTRKADILLIVTDHSQVGLRSAFRIYDVAKELKLEIKKAGIIVNRVRGEVSPLILEEIQKKGLPFFGSIAYDEKIEEADLKGTSVLSLPEDSPAVEAVDSLMSFLFKKEEQASNL
ncbi:MAG: carbon monoxide dehydrogenase, partial [Firmicutes bacterium]|nr:carbon monoxide dehydrogenase [Bacillota bacterium]